MSVGWLLIGLAAVVLLIGLRARARIRSEIRSRWAGLDDDEIRQIEERGYLEMEEDEGLDLDEIRREEERFWQETWEEPDEL